MSTNEMSVGVSKSEVVLVKNCLFLYYLQLGTSNILMNLVAYLPIWYYYYTDLNLAFRRKCCPMMMIR